MCVLGKQEHIVRHQSCLYFHWLRRHKVGQLGEITQLALRHLRKWVAASGFQFPFQNHEPIQAVETYNGKCTIMNRPKLETGLIGGLICGLIGPGLPGMELSLYGWYQGVPPALQLGRFQGRWSEILALWLYGLFLYGVPAFLIGIVFALLLRSRSARVESSARLAAEALLLGAIFGAAIPFLAFIVPLCMIPFEYSGWPRGVSIWTYVLDTLALCVRTGVFLLPKATGAGSACGLLLVWILRKRQFLRRRAPETV